MPTTIGIFSVRNDLHALAIQHALSSRAGVVCHVFETDDFVHAGHLTWSIGGGGRGAPPAIRDRAGRIIDVRALDLIWWRRANFPQRDHPALHDPGDKALVDHEWKYALFGMLGNEFMGTWINDPERGRRAENKLVQLQAAVDSGFRVPRTLVSQDPGAVRRFCAECAATGVIVKAVRGTRRRFLWATMVDESRLDDRAIALSPAIYQEFVAGDVHLRICVFGDEVHAFALESKEVDWRGDLCIPCRAVELDSATRRAIAALLRRLGLRMAIMDAKLTSEGEPVWLEANPQGQFLFAQGMTGVDLIESFSSFLHDAAAMHAA